MKVPNQTRSVLASSVRTGNRRDRLYYLSVAEPEDDITPRPFSRELGDWLGSDAPKTLGGLSEVFGERAFAVAVLLLMFPAALPLPTGGVTHVLEIITILVAAEMVIGLTTIWLPARWRHRELSGLLTGKALPFVVRRVAWAERRSKPRGAILLRQRWFNRILGAALIGLAVGALLAPPFSGLDTLPALGALGITLGIILGDLLVVVAGALFGASGIVVTVVLGAAVIDFFRSIFT